MKTENYIGRFTLLLAMIAGYCDTATFVRGNGIFSAHITGNFIIFAYSAVLGHNHAVFMKLVSFPVFVIAVIGGGWLADKVGKPYLLLVTEGAILIIAGLFFATDGSKELVTYIGVMLTVFAMGFQNAFGRLFPKEIFGVTTMMTGNVTQAALELSNLIRGANPYFLTLANLGKALVLIFGFFFGCILGGWASSKWGLVSLCAPGIAVMIGAAFSRKAHADLGNAI